MRHEDRQAAAVVVWLLFMIAVPVVVLLGMLFVTGWLAVVGGVENIHATVWGWLSERRANGTWRIGDVPPLYFLSVFTGYLAYQFCELIYASFNAFKRALR